MNRTREMYWTCPKCRKPGLQHIPHDTTDGKLITVTCEACKASYEATAVERSYPGHSSAWFGVAWI
jgi:transcription elongation factor Elf1